MSKSVGIGGRRLSAVRASLRLVAEAGPVLLGLTVLAMADRVLRIAHVEGHAAGILARAVWLLVAIIGLLAIRLCWSRQDLARAVAAMGRRVTRPLAGRKARPVAPEQIRILEIA